MWNGNYVKLKWNCKNYCELNLNFKELNWNLTYMYNRVS